MRQTGVPLWLLFLWLACGGSAAVAGEAEWKADMQAGQAAYNKGDYRSATPRFEAALKEAEAAFGREHLNTASSLAWLGVLYKAQGRYADAEPLYRRSLAIKEKALGPEHPEWTRPSTTWRSCTRRWAATLTPNRCTAARWRLGRRRSAPSTRTWPGASATWRRSTRRKAALPMH